MALNPTGLKWSNICGKAKRAACAVLQQSHRFETREPVCACQHQHFLNRKWSFCHGIANAPSQ